MKVGALIGIKWACVISGTLMLTACSDGGSGSGVGDGSGCVPVNSSCFTDKTDSGQGASVDQFDSRWLSSCELLQDYDAKYSDDARYRVESLLIAGSFGNRTNEYYTDSACAVPAIVSRVVSDLELFYAAEFSDSMVGFDNVVLVNITASNLTFDSVEPNAEQQAEIIRSGADQTFYTSIQRIATFLYIGKPDGTSDGSSQQQRILSPYSEIEASGNESGIAYIQQ